MITLSAFADEIADDLKEQMDVLEKEKIKHIAFRAAWGTNVLKLSEDQLQKAKDMMDRRGFRASSIGSPIGKVGILDDFTAHLEDFRKIILAAKLLGTKYIRIFSFYIPQGEEPAKYRSEVIRRMGEMAKIADGENVVLLHENEKDIYGDTGERCRDILETVRSKNLRVAYDPANFVQIGQRPFTQCYPLLKSHIEYVHVKDAKLSDKSIVPAGKGDGEVVEFFRELKKINYNGFASLEPHLMVAGQRSGFTGPELFHRAAQALRDILDEVGIGYN